MASIPMRAEFCSVAVVLSLGRQMRSSACHLFRLLLGEHLLVELELLALQDVAVAAARLILHRDSAAQQNERAQTRGTKKIKIKCVHHVACKHRTGVR